MSSTQYMRIIEARQPGGPEMLQLAQHPIPACDADGVLIRVAAAGLNRADILQRRGLYPPPPGAPAYPGLEVAGTIVAVGANVQHFAVGDSVCALLQGGGYAEYCAVDAAQVLPIPTGLSFVEAAALPEAYFTVWSNVFEFAHLGVGESLLVHGGASGIGSAAIQLATARGSTVYATAGTDEKCRFCEALGASAAINYRSQDFDTAIATLTEGRGVNVILDMVGGSYLAKNVAALSKGGRLIIIALQGGAKAEINLAALMQKRIWVSGSTLRARSTRFKREIKAQLLTHVWPLLERGRIKAVVDRVFPFEQAADAHRYMDTGVHRGKIVLQLS